MVYITPAPAAPAAATVAEGEHVTQSKAPASADDGLAAAINAAVAAQLTSAVSAIIANETALSDDGPIFVDIGSYVADTEAPTTVPTEDPTAVPTEEPAEPTEEPTDAPTGEPSEPSDGMVLVAETEAEGLEVQTMVRIFGFTTMDFPSGAFKNALAKYTGAELRNIALEVVDIVNPGKGRGDDDYKQGLVAGDGEGTGYEDDDDEGVVLEGDGGSGNLTLSDAIDDYYNNDYTKGLVFDGGNDGEGSEGASERGGEAAKGEAIDTAIDTAIGNIGERSRGDVGVGEGAEDMVGSGAAGATEGGRGSGSGSGSSRSLRASKNERDQDLRSARRLGKKKGGTKAGGGGDSEGDMDEPKYLPFEQDPTTTADTDPIFYYEELGGGVASTKNSVDVTITIYVLQSQPSGDGLLPDLSQFHHLATTISGALCALSGPDKTNEREFEHDFVASLPPGFTLPAGDYGVQEPLEVKIKSWYTGGVNESETHSSEERIPCTQAEETPAADTADAEEVPPTGAANGKAPKKTVDEKTPSEKNKEYFRIAAIGAVGLALLLILCCFICCCIRRCRKSADERSLAASATPRPTEVSVDITAGMPLTLPKVEPQRVEPQRVAPPSPKPSPKRQERPQRKRHTPRIAMRSPGMTRYQGAPRRREPLSGGRGTMPPPPPPAGPPPASSKQVRMRAGGWTSKQFSEGDRVSVVKQGTQTGSEGTVVDPSWDGRVKISMDNHGVIKSYLANELRLCGIPHSAATKEVRSPLSRRSLNHGVGVGEHGSEPQPKGDGTWAAAGGAAQRVGSPSSPPYRRTMRHAQSADRSIHNEEHNADQGGEVADEGVFATMAREGTMPGTPPPPATYSPRSIRQPSPSRTPIPPKAYELL
jgi:hypothetical protein